MTDNQTAGNGQTIEKKIQTGKNSSLKKGKDIQTTENTGLKKSQKSQTTVKWSVITENETKSLTAKASKKAGKKLFEWVDLTLREAAIAEIKNKPQTPAKPEDMVADIVKQFADQMQAGQAASIQAQNDLIEQQGAQIADLKETIQNALNRPQPSIIEKIFGTGNRGKTGN